MSSSRIVDLSLVRRQRSDAKLEIARGFGRLPCTLCDCDTAASDMAGDQAIYVCDGGGTHERTEWHSDGYGTVIASGRVRRFFSY